MARLRAFGRGIVGILSGIGSALWYPGFKEPLYPHATVDLEPDWITGDPEEN